ncbi:MAG TPA: cysteine dioxygenase family protein [Thermomicrobiales bacterium]|nr:cysteine dioxygenase family protein [Thermomicrobiales bacterium]
MAIETTNVALDKFTNTLDQIVRKHTNGTVNAAAVVEEAIPHFSELIADMSWLEEKFQVPVEGGIANYMLAKAVDNSWSVVSTVWWPGYGTPVHDHLIWGMVGVWKGVELERRYRRLDDGSRPNYAELEEIGVAYNRPGDISGLVPPDDDYHLIRNPADEPSYSIHVYGGSLDGVLRHSYNLETGEVTEFRSRYNIAC